ncbi:unnamed protein product [Ectocarpus sp. CCAP 1310/34]|nr:unnamed protein product [Ectocarpus sp. CCAP 1310/34]
MTLSDGIEGIDGNGVVCCPLGCGQCVGTGCSTAGAANGLSSGSCCGGEIKDSGNYCDDTGVAPCIYGSAPEDDDDDGGGGTCSDGIEGIDGNGAVCCPLGCGQCGGTGCTSAGAANGLDSGSCCGGSIKSSGNYCDDTGEAPNDLECIDHKGEICCPLGCGPCGESGCGITSATNGLGRSCCLSGRMIAATTLTRSHTSFKTAATTTTKALLLQGGGA